MRFSNLVAAASQHHKHHQKFYYDDYEPYPPEEYGNRWNNSYSPAPGITCYIAQVDCYKANERYSTRWTRNQFSSGGQ